MDPSSSERSTQDSPVNPPGSTSLSHCPSPRQTQPESASPGLGDAPIPDDEHGADLPMNMTASVMLTGLPRDAHQALADVEAIDAGKGKPQFTAFASTLYSDTILWESPCQTASLTMSVTVRFQPLPSAPILKNRVFKVSATQKFETVVKFLRKKLDCKDSDSVFCYVNSVFAPGLDEGVGGLWRVRAFYSILDPC